MSPQKGMPQSPYTHHSARDAMNKVKSPMPRLRILVVDDSPAVLKVVGRALTNEGHEVKTAKNGYVGLTMMKESLVAGSLDMVIIDMQMPVMDGLETVTRFREHEAKQKYEVYMSIATTTTATTSECTADAESISPLLSTVDTEGLSGRSTGNGNGISTFSLDDLVGENSQEFDSPSKISVRSASSTSSASSWEEPSDRRIMALDVETSVTKSPPLGTSMRHTQTITCIRIQMVA
jgi:CheY-like chemotaxis protein